MTAWEEWPVLNMKLDMPSVQQKIDQLLIDHLQKKIAELYELAVPPALIVPAGQIDPDLLKHWNQPITLMEEQPIMAVKKIEKKQAEALVVVTNPDGTKSEVQEAVDKPKFFAEQPCVVGVGAKLKMGLPNYSSAEVSVHLSVPCAPVEIDTVYSFAQNWVETRMNAEAEKLNKAKSNPAGA